MAKPNLKTHSTFLYAALAVIAAVVLRQIGFQAEDPFDWICAFLRSVIYIGLFTAWGISVRGRIIQPQVRRYLTSISGLMVFWVTARTIRYIIAEDPWVLRHLWYLYYLPMLFIPLLAVFVALSLGKPESFRLPKWAALLYIPAAALLLPVLPTTCISLYLFSRQMRRCGEMITAMQWDIFLLWAGRYYALWPPLPRCWSSAVFPTAARFSCCLSSLSYWP